MTSGPVFRRVVLGTGVALLLAFAWLGISGGLSQLSQPRTPGQTAQTVTQLAYGILALLGAASAFRGRRWGRSVLGCWAATVALAAGLASVVWGDTGVGIGIVSGGAALLVALAIVWMVRFGRGGAEPA